MEVTQQATLGSSSSKAYGQTRGTLYINTCKDKPNVESNELVNLYFIFLFFHYFVNGT